MVRKLLSLVLLATLWPQATFAEIHIKKQNIITQKPEQAKCAWTCLETMGRHFGIKSLEGLRDASPDFCTLQQASAALRKANVKHWKIYSTEAVEWAINKDWPVMVDLARYPVDDPTYPYSHCVVVVVLNAKIVQFIDPNDGARYEASRRWFEIHFNGWGIAIEPPKSIVPPGTNEKKYVSP